MDRPSSDPRNVSLALAFLRDRVGMETSEIAEAVGAPHELVRDAASGRNVPWTEDQRHAVDAIVATQSLLLDGYTPDSAAAWLNAPSDDLSGRVPSSEMTDPAGTLSVLRAAAARMGR